MPLLTDRRWDGENRRRTVKDQGWNGLSLYTFRYWAQIVDWHRTDTPRLIMEPDWVEIAIIELSVRL